MIGYFISSIIKIKFSKKGLTKMILTAVSILAAMAMGSMYYDNNNITISKYNIKSKKLPKSFNEFKILQLSDLHSKKFGKENERLIKIINKENPDIIVMTGDMINSTEKEFSTFIDMLNKLKNYKMYFVEGNNETRLPKNKNVELMKLIEEAGVKILNNSKEKLKIGEETINLYGIWLNLIYYKEIKSGYKEDTYYSKNDLEKNIGECNNLEYNILLAHNPLYFDSYAEWGADLTLSGHIHGGLIRIPGVGGLLSPERKFFPKYSEGEYKIEDKKLIVNRGLGSKIFIPRIFNMPEISLIILKAE